MAKVRVPIVNSAGKTAVLDTNATAGATVGTNLYNADGSLFDPSTAIQEVLDTTTITVVDPTNTAAIAALSQKVATLPIGYAMLMNDGEDGMMGPPGRDGVGGSGSGLTHPQVMARVSLGF